MTIKNIARAKATTLLGMEINICREHCVSSRSVNLVHFCGSPWLSIYREKLCVVMIRWQRHLRRFVFLIAEHPLNEKFVWWTDVNLVLCAVC